MAKVKIPTPLLKLAGNNAEVEVEAKTVRELIESLDAKYPGFKERLLKDGKPNRFINFYVGGEDIRFGKGLDTQIGSDSEVSIIPAISGG